MICECTSMLSFSESQQAVPEMVVTTFSHDQLHISSAPIYLYSLLACLIPSIYHSAHTQSLRLVQDELGDGDVLNSNANLSSAVFHRLSAVNKIVAQSKVIEAWNIPPDAIERLVAQEIHNDPTRPRGTPPHSRS